MRPVVLLTLLTQDPGDRHAERDRSCSSLWHDLLFGRAQGEASEVGRPSAVPVPPQPPPVPVPLPVRDRGRARGSGSGSGMGTGTGSSTIASSPAVIQVA